MADSLAPTDADGLADAVRWAVAGEQPLEVIAGGSKRDFGRPVQSAATLSLAAFDGIVDYQPSELVLTAKAATPLATIEAAIRAERQMLAFEPADYAPLLGTNGSATLGGALACNLSGPRRIKAGAARDHFLGVHAVSGRGERFKAGGRVVKNVTGYDVCKLLAGSYGTLALMHEVTVKVLPAPERTRTVLVYGLEPAAAMDALEAALWERARGLGRGPHAGRSGGALGCLLRCRGGDVGQRGPGRGFPRFGRGALRGAA